MDYALGGIRANIGEELLLQVPVPGAAAPGGKPAPAPAKPAPAPKKKDDASDYWEFKNLKLAAGGSCEPASGSEKFQAFVKQVKDDLRATRYLGEKSSKDGRYTGEVSAAIQRFKRAAMRPYRMTADEKPKQVERAAGDAPDTASPLVLPDQPTSGPRTAPDGTLDERTATELHLWAKNQYVRPLGRFKSKKLAKVPSAVGLRADAAEAWDEIYELVVTKFGLPLQGPYGDTQRNLGMLATPGASPTSRHYAGLAVDWNPHFLQLGYFGCAKNGCYENRKAPDGTPLEGEEAVRKAWPKTLHQRYFLEAIDKNGNDIGLPRNGGTTPFWRVWARADTEEQLKGLPSGVATLKVTKDEPHSQVVLAGAPGLRVSLAKMPEGIYADLSALIESTGKFTRIQAHDDILKGDGLYRGVEWWHWTFCQDGELPFSKRLPLSSGRALYASSVRLGDMAELLGITEGDLTRAGHPAGIGDKQCF